MPRLNGPSLLAFLEQNPDGDRDALALDAGYFVMRNGRPSVQRCEFLQAIADAHGTPVGRTIIRKGRRGKDPTYKVKISPKGIAPVGPQYMKQIGAEAGQYLNVIIEDGGIYLEPAEIQSSEEVPFEAV